MCVVVSEFEGSVHTFTEDEAGARRFELVENGRVFVCEIPPFDRGAVFEAVADHVRARTGKNVTGEELARKAHEKWERSKRSR